MAQDLQIFTAEVIRQMKFRKVVLTIGRDVLHACVLSCCTETIEEIAEKCKDGKLERMHPIAKKLVKERIVAEDKIKAREDPSGKSFDITFLCKILSLIEADYPSFYEKIKAVKGKRNDVCNNEFPLKKDVYEKCLTDFETLINITLEEAEIVSQKQQKKLDVSCQTNIDQISEGIKQIKELKSELKNKITKFKTETINESWEDLLEYIQTEGQKEIIHSYDKLITMNPVEFFIGTGPEISVSELYTELEFIDKKKECPILQNEVFEMTERGNPNVIIEGNSGIGKTTLIRQIMAAKKDKTTSESLLIHFACRNDKVSSLEALLARLMPKSSIIFSKEKLTSAILLLNPVFLVDGLDELNENSRKILYDIIYYVERDEATIFATSRPGVEEFLMKMKSTEIKYLEVRGILEERQQDIIEKYMRIFSQNFSTTPAPSLEDVTIKFNELRISLGEYMKVPLIICLLVYLILSTEKIDSKSTLTEVYDAITKALLKRLKHRLMESPDPLRGQGRDEMVAKFFSYVCDLSFRSLENGELILKRDTATEIFKRTEKIFGRFREDVVSSFFVCRGYITHTGYEQTDYNFPHKSFQEFFAAKHIEKTLDKKPPNDSYCEDMVRKVISKFSTFFTYYDALRYSKWDASMLKAVSNKWTKLEFQQSKHDIEDLQKVLEEEWPLMTKVELSFELQSNEPSSSIVNIMKLLKMKNLDIVISFSTEGHLTHYHCDAYIGALHGGRRSRLKDFRGCLGEEGLTLLPDHLYWLNLHIGSDRSAEALHRLGGNDGERSIKVLFLQIQPREFNPWLLPEKFPIPNGSLEVEFLDVEKDDLPWILEVMDRLLPRKSDSNQCRSITIYLRGLKREDEDAAIEFLEGLRGKSFQRMGICLEGSLQPSHLLPKHSRTFKSLEEEGIDIY